MFAFLLNLNRVSVMLGVYSNLPWFLAPYYVGATMLGARIMGHRLPRGFGLQLQQLFELSLFQGEFWRELWLVVLKPLGWSYVVGSTLGASAAGRGRLPPGARLHRQPAPAARSAAPP